MCPLVFDEFNVVVSLNNRRSGSLWLKFVRCNRIEWFIWEGDAPAKTLQHSSQWGFDKHWGDFMKWECIWFQRATPYLYTHECGYLDFTHMMWWSDDRWIRWTIHRCSKHMMSCVKFLHRCKWIIVSCGCLIEPLFR